MAIVSSESLADSSRAGMGGATSLKPCMLISSPSPPLPSPPLPYPPTPSFPPFPFLPSRPGWRGPNPTYPLPSISLPSLFSFPRGSHPLNQLGGLGSAMRAGIVERHDVLCAQKQPSR